MLVWAEVRDTGNVNDTQVSVHNRLPISQKKKEKKESDSLGVCWGLAQANHKIFKSCAKWFLNLRLPEISRGRISPQK